MKTPKGKTPKETPKEQTFIPQKSPGLELVEKAKAAGFDCEYITYPVFYIESERQRAEVNRWVKANWNGTYSTRGRNPVEVSPDDPELPQSDETGL